MNLKALLTPTRVNFDLKARNKEAVLDELIDILAADGKVIDKGTFKQAVLVRENEFTTGIGRGIAIPHAKSTCVTEAALTFGRSKHGVDFQAMDDLPANLFFLIAVPDSSENVHLQVLSFLSRKLMHDRVRNRLLLAESYEALIAAFED